MIETLACPLCASPLRPEDAVLACPCSRWPVVDGIPVFRPWARNRTPPLERVLAEHRPPPPGLLARLLRRLFPPSVEAPADSSFLELAAALGRRNDLDYFRHRFSDLSYLSSCAFLTPLDTGPVLDLACGAGHLTRALGRRVPAGRIVGLDVHFTLLYLAKRFLSPASLFVCADASARLPFKDGAFHGAFCADAFNYLPDRAGTARELLRVARGPLLLPRLADPAYRGPGCQPPLQAAGYRALFPGRAPALHLDRAILEGFLATRTLDLSTPAESGSEVLSLAAGVEARVYAGADYFVAPGTSINPIYEVHADGEQLHLRRRDLPGRSPEAYRRYEAWLPGSLTITKAQAAAGDPELVRRFVLIDLPPRYA
jgi:SAM-dependent methyltransferase